MWVAMHCDSDVAAQREAARGDRVLGLVRGQADAVHRYPSYDFELDSTRASVEELSQQLQEFLETR